MAYKLLKGLGLSEYEASKTVERFKAHDRKILYDQYAHFNDEEKLTLLAKEAAKELEELFEKDMLEAGQGR
jgi:glutathione-regulated potassium-efflux system protein KefB